MSILSTSGATSASSSSSSSTNQALTGFAALTSQDFLKMLITELQNQDPTQPVSNSELLPAAFADAGFAIQCRAEHNAHQFFQQSANRVGRELPGESRVRHRCQQ